MRNYIFIFQNKDCSDIHMGVWLNEKSYEQILPYHEPFSASMNYIIKVALLLKIEDIYMSNSGMLVGMYDYVRKHEKRNYFNWYDTNNCETFAEAREKGAMTFE